MTPISAGARIGPYEIAGLIGTGGMGAVYRARDPRLGRDVAIKTLFQDVGDRARFEVEARAASRLNHPNIVSIYDIGEEGGSPYIVFELLDGEPLRALLGAGPMAVRKLLDIAAQIADGLSAAHARDITHRDLKPENIMIVADGRVKILDFGLAKSPALFDEDGETRTAAGMLLGTLAYMSPEQAQGREVDFRSDQFSFGAILYEMASGTPAFRRADRVGTMAAVAREEPPPLANVRPPVPAPVRWVVDRCLAKEPAQRYASTSDLYRLLRDLRDHVTELSTAENTAGLLPRTRARWMKWAALAALAAVFGAGAFLGRAVLAGRGRDARAWRFTPFAAEPADETEPAWSPDGKALAYAAVMDGVAQVFVRRFDALMPAQITFAASTCRYPAWSADGSRIYYWSASALWSVAPVGGKPELVVSDVTPGYPSATISPDGRTLAFFRPQGPQQTLQLMPLPDGQPAPYNRPPFPATFRLVGGMRFAPDGRKLLVWLIRDLELGSEMWILPIPSGRPRLVKSEQLAGYRSIETNWFPDNQHIAVATAPTLGTGSHVFVLDTETGAYEPLTTGTGEEREPAISPDGDRMAFASGGAATNLLEASLDGAITRTLLATPRHQYAADWAPSGWQFVYVSDASGVPEIWMRSLAEGWAMPVVRDSPAGRLGFAMPRFSPDGQKLAYVRVGIKHLIWISHLSGGVTVPLEQESADQHAPAWSPDGQWIAYIRYNGSEWELAKASAGGGVRPVRIAVGGGAASTVEWSPAGDWICFSEGDDLRAVPPFGGSPITLARDVATFTFARDGRSLYLVRRSAGRGWELVPLSLQDGEEGRPVPLALPPEAIVTAARLHPDGRRFVLSVSTWNRDIWVLDGLHRRGWLALFGGSGL